MYHPRRTRGREVLAERENQIAEIEVILEGDSTQKIVNMVEDMTIEQVDVDWDDWYIGYELDLVVISLAEDVICEKSKEAGQEMNLLKLAAYLIT